MMSRRTQWTLLLVGVLILSLALGGCGSTAPAPKAPEKAPETKAPTPSETFIGMGTSSSGGIFNTLGVAMCQLWSEKIPNVKFSAQITGGSAENALSLGKKSFHIAMIAGSTAYEAANGLEMFKDQKVTNLRAIANLYPAVLQVPVLKSAQINNILDLKGKRINVGQAGSGTEATALNFLRSFGIDIKDFKAGHLSHANASDAMIDEKMDGYIQLGGIGIAHQMNAMASGKCSIVPLEPVELRKKFLQDYPYYFEFQIPANAYPNQDYTVDTVAAGTLLVAREDLSADLVYQMTKVLFENTETLAKSQDIAKEITLKTALDGVKIPLHPGAERYFKEKGVLK